MRNGPGSMLSSLQSSPAGIVWGCWLTEDPTLHRMMCIHPGIAPALRQTATALGYHDMPAAHTCQPAAASARTASRLPLHNRSCSMITSRPRQPQQHRARHAVAAPALPPLAETVATVAALPALGDLPPWALPVAGAGLVTAV